MGAKKQRAKERRSVRRIKRPSYLPREDKDESTTGNESSQSDYGSYSENFGYYSDSVGVLKMTLCKYSLEFSFIYEYEEFSWCCKRVMLTCLQMFSMDSSSARCSFWSQEIFRIYKSLLFYYICIDPWQD